MNHSLIQYILEICVRAPSGDNCQPWKIHIHDQSLTVEIDSKRAEHVMDVQQTASLISLGALAENLSQIFSELKVSHQIHLSEKSVLHVSFGELAFEIDRLMSLKVIQKITQRSTHRGQFKEIQIDLKEIQKNLGDSFLTGNSDFCWSLATMPPSALLDIWTDIESFIWLKTTMMRDFLKWIRIKNPRTGDGIALSSLFVSMADQLQLLMLKYFRLPIQFVPAFIFNAKTRHRLEYQTGLGTGLLLLTQDQLSVQNYFQAGRLIQKMWLTLTEQGYSVQPMAVQSLFLGTVPLRTDLSPQNIQICEKAWQMTSQYFSGAKSSPVFMLRFGRSDAPVPVSPRRTDLI